MTEIEDRVVLKVPERVIPVPTTVSPEAQAYLAMGPLQAPGYPALDDVEGWRTMVAATNQMMVGRLADSGLTSPVGFDVDELSLNGLGVYVVTPPGFDPNDTRVYLDIHGGAWTIGGGELCRVTGIRTATMIGMRVWSVDYRMPPDHPYPAAVDDCLTAYRALLEEHRPEEIVVGGGSAGGNLSAALVLRARDEGLPLPAAAILLTPALDLTQSGDTFQTNLGVDTILTRNEPTIPLLYAGGHDRRDPYISPLFGDLSKGFPPTLLASGTATCSSRTPCACTAHCAPRVFPPSSTSSKRPPTASSAEARPKTVTSIERCAASSTSTPHRRADQT